MTQQQEAARHAMEFFVRNQGGKIEDIKCELAKDAAKKGRDLNPASGRYLWEHEGRTAAIGWIDTPELEAQRK